MAFSTADDNLIERVSAWFSNLIPRAWQGFKGFLFNVVTAPFKWAWGLLKFSAVNVFQWLVNGAAALVRFNWNATDADIRRLQQNNEIAMYSVWGSLVGQGAGWLTGIAVGAGVSYVLPVIGGATLAKTIASKVGLEALDELRYAMQAAIGQTARSAGQNLLLTGYMRYRRLLKNAPPGIIDSVFGAETGRFIREQWGARGGPNLSLANIVEEKIESITDDRIRAFVESATDEYFDSFIEAGFVVAAELDDAYAQQQRQQQIQGSVRGVEVIPDRAARAEKYYLEGPENEVKQQVQSVITNHRLVYNRDIGQVVGQPAGDWYRAGFQRRQATIVFRSVPAPPWRNSDGTRVTEASYAIPDCKAGISWAELQAACRPYQWGPHRATAKLDNGRQMAVYGATDQEAENALERLLRLSTANIVALNTSEEKRRNIKLKKYPTQVYPAFATLLVRVPSVDQFGRTDLTGQTWDEDKRRWDIWRDEEPDDFVWR